MEEGISVPTTPYYANRVSRIDVRRYVIKMQNKFARQADINRDWYESHINSEWGRLSVNHLSDVEMQVGAYCRNVFEELYFEIQFLNQYANIIIQKVLLKLNLSVFEQPIGETIKLVAQLPIIYDRISKIRIRMTNLTYQVYDFCNTMRN
jgi:hypothetical protein